MRWRPIEVPMVLGYLSLALELGPLLIEWGSGTSIARHRHVDRGLCLRDYCLAHHTSDRCSSVPQSIKNPSASSSIMSIMLPNRPRVFVDIGSQGDDLGRIVIELFSEETPKTCEK